MNETASKRHATKNRIAVESFGVTVQIHCPRRDILEEVERRIGNIIPDGFYRKIPARTAVHKFSIRQSRSFPYVLFKGKTKITHGDDRENFLKYLDWQIRVTIAEYAVGRVFLHAGVVGWKGKAIIIPGKSFQGKTTLVKELTKLGAEYYSDEYAVLDEEGFVHPFPKTLSVRKVTGDFRQTDYPVEYFGGVKGFDPLPVGLVLITEYEKGARWKPSIMSDGAGVMEMLSHTIPIRYNPKFSLKVLNKAANHAIIVKTKRGDAGKFALKLLRFLENKAH